MFDRPRPAPAMRHTANLRAGLRFKALAGRAVPTTFTVHNANDSGAGSLRRAITDANAAAGDDTIAFDATFFSTPRTVSLLTALPTISQGLTVTGPGAANLTVRRDPAAAAGFRVFTIVGAPAFSTTLSGLTVSGGMTTDTTQGSSGGAGIALGAAQTLTLQNSVVTGNNASGSGGGVYVSRGGNLVVRNSTISGNAAGT